MKTISKTIVMIWYPPTILTPNRSRTCPCIILPSKRSNRSLRNLYSSSNTSSAIRRTKMTRLNISWNRARFWNTHLTNRTYCALPSLGMPVKASLRC